jgi:hypothetical protein
VKREVRLIYDDVEFVISDDITIFVLLIVVMMMMAMTRPRGNNMCKLTDGTNTQEEAPMTVNIL